MHPAFWNEARTSLNLSIISQGREREVTGAEVGSSGSRPNKNNKKSLRKSEALSWPTRART